MTISKSIKLVILLLSLCFAAISFTGCKKADKLGCTNAAAINYNAEADTDDGSCKLKVFGCTDPTATNYNALANTSNGTCTFVVVLDREALIGSYSTTGNINCPVTGSFTAPETTFVIAISSIATNKIRITYVGVSLTCTVSGTGFTIDNQTVDNYTYTGNGSVVGNALNVTINEFDGSIPETCVYTLIGTRQ